MMKRYSLVRLVVPNTEMLISRPFDMKDPIVAPGLYKQQ